MKRANKSPQRMCIACREMKEKQQLMRIVRTPEGKLLLEFASSLSDRKYDATYYRLVNIPDCPFILAFQKRQ